MKLTASEAKALSDKCINNICVETYIPVIYSKINETANQGKNSILVSFNSWEIDPTNEERLVIYSILTQDGYLVQHHSNPDPGHPCSKDYTTISW